MQAVTLRHQRSFAFQSRGQVLAFRERLGLAEEPPREHELAIALEAAQDQARRENHEKGRAGKKMFSGAQ